MRPRAAPLVVALGSIVLGLLLLEGAAGLLLPDGYYVWPPGFERTFEPDPAIISGVEGVSRFTINGDGIRGGAFDDAQRYRILAAGGSTTICSFLDDEEAWPHLVQKRLEAELGTGAVWVGNVGRPGHTVHQNTVQIEKLLPQLPRIDAVVVLAGINDLLVDVSWHDGGLDFSTMADARSSRTAAMRPFTLVPAAESESFWLGRSRLGRILLAATWRVEEWQTGAAVHDRTGQAVAERRQLRRRASGIRQALPPSLLRGPGYRDRLEKLAAAARARGVRLVLMTQPTLWRSDLSDHERALLWTGAVGRARPGHEQPYYSVDALARGMSRYNQLTLEACRRLGIECLDLAAQVPRSATFFWDDAHFTEAGAARVAEVVAAYILSTPPLGGGV